MGRSVIERSLQKRGKDFEDDTQYFSAIDANADFIITRNKKDFPQENFILEPKEFFELMNIEY
jgi:predicted nucleic acid-binding protein